jgi:hypothetical protein
VQKSSESYERVYDDNQMELNMNILSKSFVTGALVILATASSFATSMTTRAEAGARLHFRHGPHGFCVGNKKHHLCAHRWGYGGYRSGYAYGVGVLSGCGWHVTTMKKWNAAHTRVMIVRERDWRCY